MNKRGIANELSEEKSEEDLLCDFYLDDDSPNAKDVLALQKKITKLK